MARIRNWGGTVRFRPASVQVPRGLDEVRAVVRDAAAAGRRVRVMGTGHSWSGLIETGDVLLDLRHLDTCGMVDPARLLVSVGAGVRLHALNNFLTQRQLALPNLGYISAQTAVGAVMTGTHGSGPAAVLATHVHRLTLVQADGTVRNVGPEDGDLFDAARVSLGALGVVTEMQVTAVPRFNLRQQRRRLSFADAFGPQLLSRLSRDSYQHYEWVPFTDLVVHERCDVTQKSADQPEPPSPPRAGATDWLMTRAAASAGRLLPGAVPALNRMGQGLPLFRPRTRVARSDLIFNGPMAPRYHETEYALPLETGSEAMGAYREIVERERPGLNFPVMIRFAPADELWLSQAHGRATIFINIIASPGQGFVRARRALEPLLRGLGGRPHWGKLFSATPADLARAFPTYYERFRTLMARMDPAGVFRNTLLDSLFPRG
jgi:L-gulono-1,4-lactone dehydrogenase